MFQAFLRWVPLGIAVVALSGLIYVTVHQNYRQSLNDPQIQMAEDTAAALSAGKTVESLVPATQVDISTSLAPYVIVFDSTGKPIAASATLDGRTPIPPMGVFEYVKTHDQNRFSWAPKSGVRSAAVVTKFNSGTSSGFVLAGRSMREVEIRKQTMEQNLAIGTVIALVLTFLAKSVSRPRTK